ncbi:MAG: hypothetical protein QOF09_5044 [Alphaproteobacteria bacterium]|jgi:hypothetical protein|nr:hypothetical protein [Alphaproteobacteria bacterium]
MALIQFRAYRKLGGPGTFSHELGWDQNSRSRSIRSWNAFPTINAAVIAPTEEPENQSRTKPSVW